MKQKFFAFMLSLIMILSVMPTGIAFAESIFADGSGTKDDPYEIATLAQLETFRDNVNSGNDYDVKYIKLTADIDMSGTYNATTGKSWTPIGDYCNGDDDDWRFRGSFDGNGHKITGLY